MKIIVSEDGHLWNDQNPILEQYAEDVIVISYYMREPYEHEEDWGDEAREIYFLGILHMYLIGFIVAIALDVIKDGKDGKVRNTTYSCNDYKWCFLLLEIKKIVNAQQFYIFGFFSFTDYPFRISAF